MIKRFLSRLAWGAAWVVVASVPLGADENLLGNPGFEKSAEGAAMPASWMPNPGGGWKDGASSFVFVSGSEGNEVHAGSRAIRVATKEYSDVMSGVRLRVRPGDVSGEAAKTLPLEKPFSFSFFAKGDGTVRCRVYTYFVDKENYGAIKVEPESFSLDGQWRQYRGTMRFTDPGVVEAMFAISVGGGTAVIDDVELSAVAPVPVTAPASARSAAPSASDPALNVKNFGAQGDGVTDDTDAIQRCLLKAAGPEYPKSFYKAFAATPEVFFPKGTYLISRTLLAPECGSKSGLGLITLCGQDAVLKQLNPDKDILYFRLAFRVLIEGMTFEGGRRQLKLWSRNLDTAHVIIRDCVFRNSTGYAIDDQIRKRKKTDNPYENLSDMVEPYEIGFDAQGMPKLTPIDESPLPHYPFVSTTMRITRCSFQKCMGLSIWADWALLDDSAIETHPDMSGAAIISGGQLLLENVTGVAHATKGRRQCWIEKVVDGQEDGIDLKNVSLKTDTADGLCVIRNNYKFSGGRHVAVIADGCEFQSAGSEENCLVYLAEAPNLITIRNCKETSGRTVDALGFAKTFEEDYFHFHSPEIYSYVIDDCNSGVTPNLPETMAQFADKPLPPEIARRFDAAALPTVALPTMRKEIGTTLNAKDFGVAGLGTSDDSAAFQKVFTAAEKSGVLVEVLVPGGVYRMDKPVELPARVVVRGVGHAYFTVPPGRTGAVFAIPRADHVLLQNLHLFKCEQGVVIAAKADQKCGVLLDNCTFSENSVCAVTCLSGSGAAAELNQTTLRLSDCTFVASRALSHNAASALMDNPWISTDPGMRDAGAIVNKGAFQLKSLCGVPVTAATDKATGKRDIDMKGNDLRWIDNHHRVFADRCRFGGEGGGLPMVVNFSAEGYALLQNSWLDNHSGNPKRVTAVDCEEIPQLIALRGNLGWPAPQRMVTIRAAAHGMLDGRFFESGNTAPPWIRDERAKGGQ